MHRYRCFALITLSNRSVKISSRFYCRWKNFTLEDKLTLEIKQSIEKKWGSHVYGINCPAELDKNNKPIQESSKYILSMFPYPSGKLHLGHARVYTMSDVIARFYRLKGYAVIHPMGWDAFGLPAENAARDHNIEPEKWTRENIDLMKEQIISVGCSFDWKRELATCDPSYYKWTQWLFCKLWEKGLVYRKRAHVFWDPVDQTVLAEEQVDSEMKSWRSGAKVEKRLLSQWFVKTTVYSEQLMSELTSGNLKDGWRDIIDLQTHWIGPIRGEFCESRLNVKDMLNDEDLVTKSQSEPLRIWYSGTSALENAKYFILRPDHFLASNKHAIMKMLDNGVRIMKFRLKNPLTGENIPVIYGPPEAMPLVPESCDCRTNEKLGEDYGELSANETMLDTLSKMNFSSDNSDLVHDAESSTNNNFIHYNSSLKLRDWLVSRQRKWGTPIPVVNCLDCGHSSIVPIDLLPVTPATKFQDCCSSCKSDNLELETDTLDTFFDSSWYFLRYLDPSNSTKIFDVEKVRTGLPVDVYIGGKEHATLHLYYARFMNHFLHTLGLVSAVEPFQKLIPIGVVMGEAYCVKNSGKYLKPEEVTKEESKYTEKSTGEPVLAQWEKMSKSKHNGIDPSMVLQEFGIDMTRLLSVSEAAPTSARHWPPKSLQGLLNWQTKVWTLMGDFVNAKDFGDILFVDDEEWATSEAKLFDARNYYLKGITHNYAETSQISVVVSRLQGLLGSLRGIPSKYLKESIEFERALGVLLIAMYPIMPAFSAQLWQSFRAVATSTELEYNLDKEIWEQSWPEVDENYHLDLTCNINGEEFIVKVERQYLDGMDEDTAVEVAFDDEKVADVSKRENIKIKSYQVKPGFGANLQLIDTTRKVMSAKSLRKEKKKQKLKAAEKIEVESTQ